MFVNIHTHVSTSITNVTEVKNHIIGLDNYSEGLFSAGIHPWHINGTLDDLLIVLESLSQNPRALAIGECGLDKLCDTAWTLQIETFKAQIKIANKQQKPLIIHAVRSHQEILKILEMADVPAVFHGYNKSLQLCNQLIEKKHYISLGNSILYKKQDDLIKQIPLSKLFFETDDKSIDIVDIYSYFCDVRKITLDKLKEQILLNFERVFKHKLR